MRRAYFAAGLVLWAAAMLAACSPGYHSISLYDRKIKPDLWHVRYGGNAFTTDETAQTYWLYRCAEITLEKGYTGFEIVTSTHLSDAGRDGHEAKVAQVVFVPMEDYYKPVVVGDIHLLNAPFTPVPGKIFDAAALKAELDPYVNGPKCDNNNVCPHVHRYLYPVG